MIDEQKETTIKSISYDQSAILESIYKLHLDEWYQCDITDGNGSFWKGFDDPKLCFDLEPLKDHVIFSDSASLPLKNDTLKSIVFDPPFLTYIKNGRDHGSILGKRFSGYWKYSELESHYKETLKEMGRVLMKNGVCVFKCQDIVHNHKLHCTHNNVIGWAESCGFRVKDLFILLAKNRMNVGNNKTQRHARIHHSYFIVLVKTDK